MALGMIGQKVKMTRIYNEKGQVESVTVIKAGPCKVLSIKDGAVDSAKVVQIGYREIKAEKTNKPRAGYFKKIGTSPVKILKEFTVPANNPVAALKTGDTYSVDIFAEGETVDVQGISKGKGFAGVVKRWKFKGGPQTHGQSDRERAPGSVGQSSYPSRVLKGLRMGGRMGNAQTTIKNLKVLKVYKDDNLLLVRGAVPGTKDNYIIINKQA
jgi:large subunit ribosomal protein L3